MITKQQALEFIYELSQKTEVMLDIACGEVQFSRIIDGDYQYTTYSELSTFESAVTKCIKENMDAIECLGVKNIPVDIGMLEVGQTYKVSLDDIYDGCRTTFNAKLIEVIEEKYKFLCEDGSYYKDIVLEKNSFYEIYKVVE